MQRLQIESYEVRRQTSIVDQLTAVFLVVAIIYFVGQIIRWLW
ncbi:MAG: hypothetical protein H6Q67_2424 [Firmicutes bacterium]|nr:hypothetical protein [Bacillota bacterium]